MPNNWKKYKLGDIANIVMGQSPKSEFYNNDKIGLPFLQGNRTFGRLYPTFDTYTTDAKKIAEKGSVLFSVRAPVGDINIATDRICIGRGLCSFQLKKGDNLYLLYLLKHYKNTIVNQESGTVFGSVNKDILSSIEVYFPENDHEQKSIASILSAIDDKIENNLAINKTLEEMAMALYKHWFVDFGPFQDGEFVESELGRIPKGWEVKRLDEIITVKRGGSPRPIQDYLASEGLPWVKISDATASNSPYLMDTKEFIKEEGLRKTVLLKKGSLILSNSASPGIPRFLELDACIHDGWLHFPEINRFGKYLLYLTFLRIKEELIQKGNGSVFTNLKTDILKSQLVTLPPLDIEQKINSQIKSYFKQIRNNCLENQTLTQLRDTLLPKLISGEVRLKEFQES